MRTNYTTDLATFITNTHRKNTYTKYTIDTDCPIMGWLRLVGSLKSYVSFAEYRLFYRALLQKRPIILRRLLIVATPYARACRVG